jgi:fibronectin type 3 domain-containing protein
MRNNLIKIFLKIFSLYLAVLSLNGWSQNTIKDSLPSVQLLSRVQENQILLRWAVNEPIAWKKTNTSGFILEKYVFFKNGKRLVTPQKLWSKPIKAAPLETWQEIVEKDNYAAIIAQALYGEHFNVGGNAGKLADIVNQSQELEQRFSFALLAADMNFEASTKAGWGYTDLEVKPTEKYAYKIKSALPQEQLAIKSAAVLAGLKDFEPLPAPIDLQGVFGDKNAIITWEYKLFKNIYTSYQLERSTDGAPFTPVSTEPLVNLNDKPNAPAKRMYYIDSLAQNNRTYYYRVQGISPFGEKGAYSKTISGQGKPILPYTPRIRDFKFTKNPNEAVIVWEFPKEGEVITEKFQLNQSDKDEGPYTVVIDNIAVSQREITYSELDASNYITITAVGKTPNQKKTSFSRLIQPIDSIPPTIPTELEGTIDSLGVARINWKMNVEKDFLGYRVFRGFTAKEEPAQITVAPITTNQYIDTIEVKNLNSKVYYQLVAVDKRFNHSKKSTVVALEKPDVIPPTAPVFSNYKIKNGTVQLSWFNSSEENATHSISRKNLTDNTAWQEIYTATDTLQMYTDTSVEADKTYTYTIKAIDKSGLESLPSAPLTISIIHLKPKGLMKEINFNVYREDNYIELFWRADDRNIIEYTVYKQENEKDPTTWRIVPVSVKRIIDTAVNPNTVYTYHIRATLSNGTFTQVKKVEIKF